MSTRINKTNKATPVSADELLIYDSQDTSDDKNITLGQVATFTENQNSTVAGTKIFSSGVDFQKGFIAYGQYSPLPTGIGSYIAGYTHPTYGARVLWYNGIAYQDLAIGSMPTAGTPSIKSLANGDVNFGYNTNIAGNCTANKFYGDGSELSGIIFPQTICSTASGTAAKTATLSGVTIVNDVHFYLKMTNANTSSTITLNINSEGDWGIYDLKGNQITGNYFSNATNETCLFKVDKTNSRFILITAPFWESRMGMPSNVYVDLTLGGSGSTYTAPADGYFAINTLKPTVGQVVLLNTNTLLCSSRWVDVAGYSFLINCKARKGDIVKLIYDNTLTLSGAGSYFVFIYAEGSKP